MRMSIVLFPPGPNRGNLQTMISKQEIHDHFAKFGKKGGQTTAKKRTPEERAEAARKAVQARWAKERAETEALNREAKKLLKTAQKREKKAQKKKH